MDGTILPPVGVCAKEVISSLTGHLNLEFWQWDYLVFHEILQNVATRCSNVTAFPN